MAAWAFRKDVVESYDGYGGSKAEVRHYDPPQAPPVEQTRMDRLAATIPAVLEPDPLGRAERGK